MPTTFNDNLPNLGSLQAGDTILFGDNLNYQSPNIQSLIGAGSVSPYLNNGQMTGVNVIKPYTAPETQYTYDPGQMGMGFFQPGVGTTYMKPTGTQPVNPYEGLYNQEQFNQGVPTGLEQYTQQYQDLLTSQQAALESQYQTNIAQIGTQYGQAIQQTKDVGGRTMGALSRILGRAGGFTTTAGGMAIISQENQLQGQVNQLKTAQNNALGQALMAKQTGNATLLQNSTTDLYNIQKDIKAAQDKRASNLLDLLDRMTNWEEEQQQLVQQQQQAEAEGILGQQKLKQQQQKEILDLQKEGYQYISTPAERDELKNAGYNIVELNGKTYAKPGKLTKVTYKGKTTWYDEQGNVVKGGATGGGTVGGGATSTPSNVKEGDTRVNAKGKTETFTPEGKWKAVPEFDTKVATSKVKQYFYGLTGEDKKVSPDDYNAAKQAWISDGGTAESFDAAFFTYKNPNNPNY